MQKNIAQIRVHKRRPIITLCTAIAMEKDSMGQNWAMR